MKITGQILKDAREKKGISIAEVSLATKINTRVITAMEDGNLAKLPPKTFLRGFVLSYATFLQLDLESLMAKFQEEFGAMKPEVKAIEEAVSPAPRNLDPIAPNTIAKIASVVAVIVLFALIVLLRNKMESYHNETITAAAASPTPSITPAADAIPVAVATPMTAATPSAGTTPATQSSTASTAGGDFVGGLTALSDHPSSNRSADPAATATPQPVPTVAASATPKPAATLPPKVMPSPKPSPSPGESPSPSATPKPKAAGQPQDVTLEALDNVSVDATIDDEPVRKITLKPDQVQTIKAKRKVSLQLSDGGAVNIIVNGTDRGVPGDLGQPKKVDIP